MRAKSVLVVADCCLAGANTHATTTRLGRGLDERYFQITFENRARLVLTSSPAARAAAASASRGHSPFAENFLQVLRASRIVMSGQELACELGERLQPVGSQTRSDLTPIYSVLTGAGHDNGEFFFIPSPAVSAGAERVAAVL
jgi:hypothetical protein